MPGREDSIPAGLNSALAAAHAVLNLFQFFILPLYLLPKSLWWGLLLLPIAALNNSFWSVIHEAIHDLFHPTLRANAVAGRLLSVLFGSPFRVLRLSHLMHHTFNRTPQEATEAYDPENTSRTRAGTGYYFQILGGLYLIEALGPLLFFLPRSLLGRMERSISKRSSLNGWLVRSLARDNGVGEIRKDTALVLLVFGSSAVCYGENWPLLAAFLVARAFLISFLDNVYHYGTPVNDVAYAMNLWLPPVLSKALLYFNLHGIHHGDPTLPWIQLPQSLARQGQRFGGNYAAAAFDQLIGAIPISELPDSRAAITTYSSTH